MKYAIVADYLRMCKWAEQGGDGQLHFICPKWKKRIGE